MPGVESVFLDCLPAVRGWAGRSVLHGDVVVVDHPLDFCSFDDGVEGCGELGDLDYFGLDCAAEGGRLLYGIGVESGKVVAEAFDAA